MGRRLCLFNGAGVSERSSRNSYWSRQERVEDWFGESLVCWKRDFGLRLGTDDLFGGKQGAHRLLAVMSTKCGSVEL